MDDKIIVTNRGALTRKYGAKGLAAIRKALSGLIAEDKKRGIKTAVLYLDDGPAMKKLGAKPVSSPTAIRETKNAVDKIYASLQPDYVLILGAPDVVPHQDLNNPAFGAGDDDNRAWGDVPYACDVPYSRDPADFVGPTRVVGRLPDLVGANEPSYLVDLVGKTAKWQSRPASDYTKYFGLSAEVWKGSTQLSLENIFGHAEQMLLSPKSGPKYISGELGARMHFINCHGALAAPEFYGQSGTNFPISLTTPGTKDSILDGTVAAVECCYGGELYDSVTLSLAIPDLPELFAAGRLRLSRQHDHRLRACRRQRRGGSHLPILSSQFAGGRIDRPRRVGGASAICRTQRADGSDRSEDACPVLSLWRSQCASGGPASGAGLAQRRCG